MKASYKKLGFTKDTSGWEKLKKNLIKGNGMCVDVGAFQGTNYGPENDNLPVAQVMAWNEEGHTNGGIFNGTETPPRPFMRYYISQLEKEKKMGKAVSKRLQLVLAERMSWEAFYKSLGAEAVSDLKKVIEQWFYPPNSAATIDMKGFNNPLQETDTMLNSVDSRVSKNNKEGT